MSKRDTSQLRDIFQTALVVYLYGEESLVGIDVAKGGTHRDITFLVAVPECDLQILQAQYHAKEESVIVLPKPFVDAYQFVLRMQKQVYKNAESWRATSWIEGRVG